MTNDEILDDIKVIIEAEYAKREQTWGRAVISFSDETVPLLNVLSNKLETNEERHFFWGTLQNALEKSPPNPNQRPDFLIYSAADRIIIFLMSAGKMEDALNYFKLERNLDYYLISVLKAISNFLVNEPHYFNRQNLMRLEDCISNISSQIHREEKYDSQYNQYVIDKAQDKRIVAINGKTLKKPILPIRPKLPRLNYVRPDNEAKTQCTILVRDLLTKIKLAKFNVLKISYQGNNLEINQDKEELKLKIKDFNFNPELSECLDKFELDYQEATDNFDLKSCVGHIRTFTEKLVISIAQMISKETKVSPNASIESIGGARQYLRDGRVDFLSQKQDDFLGSFYGLASDEHIGAHSLTSDREHARIIKNEGIELGLFLVKLLDKCLNEVKNPIA